MAIESFTYIAPAFLAPYLVNGDASGMTDQEVAACDAWVESLPGQWCVDASEESVFVRYNDANYFFPDAGDCLRYTFHK